MVVTAVQRFLFICSWKFLVKLSVAYLALAARLSTTKTTMTKHLATIESYIVRVLFVPFMLYHKYCKKPQSTTLQLRFIF
jgi:hypothetical protein